MDGRTLCLKKLLFRNLVLCEENYFFPFVQRQKRIFYLPFLAHGLERFLLLVAVGEAGRPNVNDDLCFCLVMMKRFFLIYILTLGCRCMPWRVVGVGSRL